MAESTLSLSLTSLTLLVGRFLGYKPDPDDWSARQASEVDDYVQTGVRQFYYPPAMPGFEPGYEWSFLRPWGSIDTVESQADNVLPDDFSRLMAGGLMFAADFGYTPVAADVGAAKILTMRQTEDFEGLPTMAAVKVVAAAAGVGQRKTIMWYPTPDAAYTLAFRYEAYAEQLTAEQPYPLGGMKHADCVAESCLAVAEQRANDEAGLHTARFEAMLVACMVRDKREGATNFGQTGRTRRRGHIAPPYSLTVSGVTIQ